MLGVFGEAEREVSRNKNGVYERGGGGGGGGEVLLNENGIDEK